MGKEFSILKIFAYLILILVTTFTLFSNVISESYNCNFDNTVID